MISLMFHPLAMEGEWGGDGSEDTLESTILEDDFRIIS